MVSVLTPHSTPRIVVLFPQIVTLVKRNQCLCLESIELCTARYSPHELKPVTLDDHSKVEPPLFHSEQDRETP